MKNTILFLSALIFITINPIQAKDKKDSEIAKIATPEVVLNAFVKSYPNANSVVWTQVLPCTKDSLITEQWFFANFKNNEINQRVKYKNNSLFSVEFEVQPQFYPNKIVQYVNDTLGVDYKITRLAVEQKQSKSVYFVELSKGKKKTAEHKYLYFTLKGDFMKELPENTVALDFIRF